MEEQADYVTEAMDLLNGEPAAIIEQPRSRLVLRDGLGEEWTVAWVKMSTAFKPHIKELRGSPLAVWLYLCLSINKQGVAYPGIRTIAEDTGYSHQGVLDAITILEEKGYLKVRRGERKFNLYEPEFAAIGRVNEPSASVNLVDSTDLTGQLLPADESSFSADESSGVDLNKRNKKKQDITLTIENAIATGQPITDKAFKQEQARTTAPKQFENALGFSKPLPWWDGDKDWRELGEWVCAEYNKNKLSFGEFNIWRNTKFTKGGISNSRLRGFPKEFYDAWDTFMMSNPQHKTDEQKPTYKVRPQFDSSGRLINA